MYKNLLGLGAAVAALAVPAAAQEAAQAPAASTDPGLCVAGYILADEDGDGILSRAEAEALWEAEFAALDADASGDVTNDELVACLGQVGAEGMAPRNVSPTGSGPLDDSGLMVEIEGLVAGSLSRAAFMEAAMAAFDATGNEEENQLEWARAFIWAAPGESETDIRAFGRDGYAARAAMLFRQLDSDADGALTPEEWVAEGAQAAGTATGFDRAFPGLDVDTDGAVTLTEYAGIGAARFDRARQAALDAGWEDLGDHAAGIGTEGGEGEVVATDSEGLTGEDGTTSTEVATDAQDATPEDQGEAPEDGSDPGTATAPASGATGGVPVFNYRFGD
jgi:hypothetical protein